MTTRSATYRLDGPSRPFAKLHAECVGSCHAYLTLREDWREHFRRVQKAIGFKRVRFHGILHDLVGIYRGDHDQKDPYNFRNLFKIVDFLLENGAQPFLELSFMPYGLASGDATIFQYRGNITPPKDEGKWSDLVTAFTTSLIDRYGLAEVRSWYFEVWNEPDIDAFWSGGLDGYLRLYELTARAVKAVDSQLRVGGPATSKNQWIDETSAFCAQNNVPLDFVSTHHYCADVALEMGRVVKDFAYRGQPTMAAEVRDTVAKVRAADSVDAGQPAREVHYTEWNISPIHEDVFGKDSAFSAVFALQTLRDVTGLVGSYSWWTLSDIFEESGPGLDPFSGKYGLINVDGVNKPVFHAFRWLSELHDHELLPEGQIPRDTIATRAANGNLAILSWNFSEATKAHFFGEDWTLDRAEIDRKLRFEGLPDRRWRVRQWVVDEVRGNAFTAWRTSGRPRYPRGSELEALKAASEPVMVEDRLVDLAHDEALDLQTLQGVCGVHFWTVERT
ncbi:MAG: hypothetical protein WCG80_07950 [Spirochaetales bacterium]